MAMGRNVHLKIISKWFYIMCPMWQRYVVDAIHNHKVKH